MTKRSKMLSLIFFGLVIVGGIFIYFYQVHIDNLLAAYIDEISACSNITSEDECAARAYCEGIYRPTCEGCPEVEFEVCARMSEKQIEQMKSDQKLCEKTGGLWHRNELSYSCFCRQDGEALAFDRQLGCVKK